MKFCSIRNDEIGLRVCLDVSRLILNTAYKFFVV